MATPGPGPAGPPPPTGAAEEHPPGGGTPPGTRAFHALATSATHALSGLEDLVDPGVPGDWHATRYRIQPEGRGTRLHTMARVFADAGNARRPHPQTTPTRRRRRRP